MPSPLFWKTARHRRRWSSLLWMLGRTGLGASVIAVLLSATALADKLAGIIVDTNGNPKSSVLIDIVGPTKIFTRSDPDGRFSVDVPTGHYLVRIRDGRRRAETEVFVSGTVDKRFRVGW